MTRYDFTSDVTAGDLQPHLDAHAAAGWRVHSIWQRSPDARQPARLGVPLVVYDVLFEREDGI